MDPGSTGGESPTTSRKLRDQGVVELYSADHRKQSMGGKKKVLACCP